ncbi:hypothetical protein AQJ58_36760 [Streptomyces sp. DSM 15324]|nr:hypothetical protein AQJ58_36760 [Streptomyces sp. DSM 15324]
MCSRFAGHVRPQECWIAARADARRSSHPETEDVDGGDPGGGYVDYHWVGFAEVLKGIDVVLDPISLDTDARARCLAVLRLGGTLVSILPVPVEAEELTKIGERGIRFGSLLVGADRVGVQAVAGLVESGALRVHIEAMFPLAEAAQAHTRGETGRTTGRIVLTVKGTGKAQTAVRALRAAVEEEARHRLRRPTPGTQGPWLPSTRP